MKASHVLGVVHSYFYLKYIYIQRERSPHLCLLHYAIFQVCSCSPENPSDRFMQNCSWDLCLPWSKAFIWGSSSPPPPVTRQWWRGGIHHTWKKSKGEESFTAVPSSWDIFNQNWKLTYISIRKRFFLSPLVMLSPMWLRAEPQHQTNGERTNGPWVTLYPDSQ